MPPIPSSQLKPAPSALPETETKDPLRPYRFLGLDLQGTDPRGATCDCPFCAKDGKLSVSPRDGRWQCWYAGCPSKEGSEKGGGNLLTFMRLLHKQSADATNGHGKALSEERGFLLPESLSMWGVCQSTLTNDWIAPGYSVDGRLVQLYRYILDRKTQKRRFLPTPTLSHGMLNAGLPKKSCQTIYLCEGVWDGIALWEVLRSAKPGHDGAFEMTSSELSSLLVDACVLAAPGCNLFYDSWFPVFSGRKVCILYHSDHPPKTGRGIPAGFAGAQRVTKMLSMATHPPCATYYLAWGPDGYDPFLKSGYDVRDLLTQGKTMEERVTSHLSTLFQKITDTPAEWVSSSAAPLVHVGSGEIECAPCEKWKDCVKAWQEWGKWTEGLDRGLSTGFACILSTKALGDPLWIKMIGPPSCGKSTLCEAWSVNKKFVTAKSTITGIHSGYKTDREGKEDHSLIPIIADKTLIIKDADTLLQQENLLRIMAELRDLYDGTTRAHYRHGISHDYAGLRTTIILSGTKSLRRIDQSILGERFLDTVVTDRINEDVEAAILDQVAARASDCVNFESDGDVSTHHHPALLKAMRLTGGYVGYLRSNANTLLKKVVLPDGYRDECIRLGKLVAYLRARPADIRVFNKQEEAAERELAARLVSQLIRLSKCTAVVLNTDLVDKEVMRRTRRVAMDTGLGRTMDIVGYLNREPHGLSIESICIREAQTEERIGTLLRFMKEVGILEVAHFQPMPGVSPQPRWKLSQKFRTLYQEVMNA